MIENKVVVVTVTYGNRLSYLKKIIAAISEYKVVKKIIVVNNGSNGGNLSLDDTKNYIHVINNKKNLGSAAGYGVGLKYAFTTDANYVWLLDDDNCPVSDCLPVLLSLYEKRTNKNELYTAFRDDRLELKNAGQQHYIPNSFFGFSIAQKLNPKTTVTSSPSNHLLKCDSVPYGGLLLPIDVARENGLPNTNYYLYNDDNDYTYRLTQHGFRIFCSLNSKIHDLENSWYRRESGPMFEGFFRTDMLRNGVYTIRNRTYFELNNTVNNRLAYYTNIAIYLIYVFLFYMPKNKKGFKRYQLILQMVKAGINGRLGKIKVVKYSGL